MAVTSSTADTVCTRLIRLARTASERHDWYVVTIQESLTRSKVDPDPDHHTGSIDLKVQSVSEYGLGRGLPTTFGGRFEWHIPGITRPTVRATNGYVLIEDKAHRGRGLGTYLMGYVIRWLQAHAEGDALLYAIELQAGISEAQAERVKRFYARFGLRFEPGRDGQPPSTSWDTPLKALVAPPTSAAVSEYDEVDGWLAFFAELRAADERRHGDHLGNQWRDADRRIAQTRRRTWLQAGGLVAFVGLLAFRLLH